MRAFILAGGYATRLWPLTESRAKPLLPLAGTPIITHIVDHIPASIAVTVSTNAVFEEDFFAWKRELSRDNLTIRIEHTRNDDEKLGALGAIRQWIEEEDIRDDVLILTGDNYFGFNMNTFIDQYVAPTPLLAAYDIRDPAQASAFGTVILEDDGKHIAAFEEKPRQPKTSLVSTGCSILPASLLPVLCDYAAKHPDNVGGIFEELLRQNHSIDCFTFGEPWFDVGSFEAYLEATRSLVGERVLKSEGATFDDASIAEGSVVLGHETAVSRSTLRNTTIFDRCRIQNCILENCIIDNDCELAGIDLTGKMIRAGTRLIRE